ncbi:hypothetical protein [Kitasatospora sp. MAP5-34]|uniref:hypothetical protein n=1 Tax=Kitasatospora sp. MAP5-34 TaxID=3035102 RepID=UPI0024741C86|nr:hypothetical protein [Kitasatospora sp. MAP5-34]MDH6577774.1 hypothetical protein [Kitasatospora sp. MAP5-34]
MTRTILAVAGVVGAMGIALVGAVPAGAATVPTTTSTTCGNYGLQAGLATKLCATVTDGTVQLTGQLGLAGPSPLQEDVVVTLSGNVVGGGTLGTVQQSLHFQSQTLQVGGVGGTVPCGSTVHGSFSVASFGRFNTPVTIDVPVNC